MTARIAKIARITILSKGKAYKQKKERKPSSNIFISKLKFSEFSFVVAPNTVRKGCCCCFCCCCHGCCCNFQYDWLIDFIKSVHSATVTLLTMSFASSLNCPSALQILRVHSFKSCLEMYGRDLFFAVRNCLEERWDISCKMRGVLNFYSVKCAYEERRYSWLCKTEVKRNLAPFCCDPVCPT